MGHHLIKTWSSTQTLVSLSSGEAEFYALVKGVCEGLGIVGLNQDLGGARLRVVLSTDSSVAKGIACRRGCGRVKHLETRTLWIQDHTNKGHVKVLKVHGETNVADLLTKFLNARKLDALMESTPTTFGSGRSALIPELQGKPSGT